MEPINVTDAGPIEGTFTIDLSPGPGAYEFRGARGSGKTTCISTIDWLAGHKVDVTLHDGALSGSIKGFGVVAPIGGRKRRKGDLGLDTIDAEKFSLADVLDPPGKTPEVRDATRIKALAVLCEAKADPTLYHGLAGGQQEFYALGLKPTDDPVLLATRVKEAFDQIAREKQRVADAEATHAAQLEHTPEDLDLTCESDLAALGARRDAARDVFQKLTADRVAGLAKEQEIARAAERLKAIRAEYKGPTAEEAESRRQDVIARGTAAKSRVEELERELLTARQAVEVCKTEYGAANATYEAAKSHASAVDELTALSSQTVEYPADGAVKEAERAIEAVTADYVRGVRIRDVKQNHATAAGHRKAEKAAAAIAAEAKNKAGQVFDVLAQSLYMQHITIGSVDGVPRLFVNHPKRGRTAVDQVNGLSDGERVDYVLRELLPHIESPGLLPIPQRVWQDLQPTDRQALHVLAVEKELYLFGAQVDDGELRVVFLGSEDNV